MLQQRPGGTSISDMNAVIEAKRDCDKPAQRELSAGYSCDPHSSGRTRHIGRTLAWFCRSLAGGIRMRRRVRCERGAAAGTSVADLVGRQEFGDAALRPVRPPATPIGAVEARLGLAHGRHLMLGHAVAIRGRTCFQGRKQGDLDAARLGRSARAALPRCRILRCRSRDAGKHGDYGKTGKSERHGNLPQTHGRNAVIVPRFRFAAAIKQR